MRGPIDGYWGKLARDAQGAVLEWHPLVDHCADVAACAEALLTHTLLGRRLARLAGLHQLDLAQVARLSLLAALHDLGKFNRGFQAKAGIASALEGGRGAGAEGSQGGVGARPLRRAGHVAEAVWLLTREAAALQQRLVEAIDVHTLVPWVEGEGIVRLLCAAIAHHGEPVSFDSRRFAGKVTHFEQAWRVTEDGDPMAGVASLSRCAQSWFPEAFTTGSTALPESPQLEHAFSGLVMLADWLGSTKEFFAYSEFGAGDRMSTSRRIALEAVRGLGLDPTLARASLGLMPPGFEQVYDGSPRPAQQAVLGVPASAAASLVVLEAETGSGKTEAAFLRYLRLLHAGEVDGMYFALPTRTAATQIYERAYAVVLRAFPDALARPPVTLAVPGYLSTDGVEGRLAGFEALWPDNEADRWRHRGWAAEHPKRYLAGAVVVGTVDQVLLSTLGVRHAEMRATALSRLLLVVDEVHASDAYMTSLLEAVLHWHLCAGGHALLMSATLGSRARGRLLGALPSASPRANVRRTASLPCASGLSNADYQALFPSLEAAVAVPFPAVQWFGCGARAPVVDDVGRRDSLTTPVAKLVQVRLSPSIDEPMSIAGRALEAAGAGARVLVIRSTVSGCLATQAALEALAVETAREGLLLRCAGLPVPHHSRYARADRRRLDHAVEAALGKVRSGPAGVVAVATQTVEQSLDLDADLLLTDLCPMDVLLQRIGRLHRHERARPTGFRQPVVEVLVPAERDLTWMIGRDGVGRGTHAFGTVYSDLRVLEATWRELERRPLLELPMMNRSLVEQTTHEEVLEQLENELGPSWKEHGVSVQGKRMAHQNQARSGLIDRTAAYGDHEFPSGELERRLMTRLGEGDRIVHFAEEVVSVFGERLSHIILPAWLVRPSSTGESSVDKLSEGSEPVAVRRSEEGLRFEFLGRAFVYDRLGVRPDAEEEAVEARGYTGPAGVE